MNAAERITKLREILFNEPSPEGWERLVGIYHDWDYKDDLAVGIDYAVGPLEAWPEALRLAPESWCRVMLGEPKHLIKRRWERGQRAHPAMKLVRTLDLGWSPHWSSRLKIQASHLKKLARAKPLAWITRLRLDTRRFGDDGAYELSQAVHLRALRHLSVESCDLSPQGVWDLLEGEGGLLEQITSLNLSNNPIGDEGARGLAQTSRWRRLELSRCKITPRGWSALAASGCLEQLEHLRVDNLDRLLSLELPALRTLDVSEINCPKPKAGAFSQWVREHRPTLILARYAGDGLKEELQNLSRELPWLEVRDQHSQA